MTDRVLRDTQATAEVTFYAAGIAVDADGAVTVDITRADGSALVTDGVTTKPPATTGIYRYTLAPQTDLDELTVVWEGTFGAVVQRVTTGVDIAGAYYVAVADIRALDNLNDVVKFPNEKLEETRRWFEDLAESHCGVAFVPRYGRDVLSGDGSNALLLSRIRIRKLLSVKVDDVEVATSSFKVSPIGKVTRTDGTFPTTNPLNVEISYEHGLDGPPADLREATLRVIRSRLLVDKSTIPERSSTIGAGSQTLPFRPDETRPTGVPSVDATLEEHRLKLPGIA